MLEKVSADVGVSTMGIQGQDMIQTCHGGMLLLP
jgi:hypothetical protein